MKIRLVLAILVSICAWIGALCWLYDGETPPLAAWKIFGLPPLAFALFAVFRGLAPLRPASAREWVLLAAGMGLLAAAWCADLGLFPVWPPLAPSAGQEGLRLWPFGLALAAWAGLLTGRTLSRDLRAMEALLLVLAAAGISWGGASVLREHQEVPRADLSRIFLDRRADPSGDRPRSNIRMESGAARTVKLEGVLANENPFPVWGVEVDFELDGTDPVPLRLQDDILAHDTAPLLWSGRYRVEDLDRRPGWKVVVRRARRHWGGGPRLTAREGAVQSPPP